MLSSLTKQKQVLIFTDFDGTILDHYTYSYDAAKTSIVALGDIGIPVIPNTSKTLAEVKELRKEMGLNSPLIVENGAGIYIPKEFFPEKPRGASWQQGFWVKSFAQKRSHWQDKLKKLSKDFGHCYESFSSMSITRIIEVTGLDANSANLASKRQFSEPLLWKGSDQEREKFIQRVTSLGARPLTGGRFLHLCGDTNKGKALTWLVKEYQRQYPQLTLSSIALGDGNNDIDMLEVADYAVRISSPTHSPPSLKRTKNVYTSTQMGPQGWAEVLREIIPELSTRIKHG